MVLPLLLSQQTLPRQNKNVIPCLQKQTRGHKWIEPALLLRSHEQIELTIKRNSTELHCEQVSRYGLSPGLQLSVRNSPWPRKQNNKNEKKNPPKARQSETADASSAEPSQHASLQITANSPGSKLLPLPGLNTVCRLFEEELVEETNVFLGERRTFGSRFSGRLVVHFSTRSQQLIPQRRIDRTLGFSHFNDSEWLKCAHTHTHNLPVDSASFKCAFQQNYRHLYISFQPL